MSLQSFLHGECFRQGYLQDEITAVGAPVNVLFTKRYKLARDLFPDQAQVLRKTDEFFVQRVNGQVIIECAHPGRRPREWRDRLTQIIRKYIQGAEPL